MTIALLSCPDLNVKIEFYTPPIFIPFTHDVTLSLLVVVLAQVVLTFSNAVLATCLAVNERFPNKKIAEERVLRRTWDSLTPSFHLWEASPCAMEQEASPPNISLVVEPEEP